MLVCDAERLPGCREFIDALPEEKRRQRLGLPFPLLTGADTATAAEMVEAGVAWVCREHAAC